MSSATLGLGDWSFEPTVAIGLAALCGGYVLLWRRGLLRAGDDTAAWFRPASLRPWFFGLGIASAFVALQSPIDTGGDRYLLTLHMVQHLVLMMVSPPLVLLGAVGMRAPASAPRGLRLAWDRIARPWPATLLLTAVMLLWHLPTLYDATLTNDLLHIVEHVTFVAAGVVFWWPIVDPIRGPDVVPVGAFQKIGALVLGGIPPTALGFVFVMAHSAYYGFYAAAPRLWGLTPLNDQQFAGVVMLGVGNLVYFLAVTVVFLRMFGDPERDEADAAAGQPAG